MKDKENIDKELSEIIAKSKKIDTELISKEVLTWIINNVEMFVDSTVKTFKLDLIIDDKSTMNETKKLQNLYRQIPDDEKLVNNKKLQEKVMEIRETLDEITQKVYECMTQQKEMLDQLFKRMIFFYEKVVPSSENKKRAHEIDEELKNLIFNKDSCKNEEEKKKIQKKIVEKVKEGESLVKFDEMEGTVSILRFEYESFDVSVSINQGMSNVNEETGEIEESKNKKTIKSYNIPESLTVWLQISNKIKQKPTVMF
jgi:uncharacterized membrane-anchored protein YhcB (DUF1043 family)